jgi:hypothetical protein
MAAEHNDKELTYEQTMEECDNLDNDGSNYARVYINTLMHKKEQIEEVIIPYLQVLKGCPSVVKKTKARNSLMLDLRFRNPIECSRFT